MVSVLLAIVAGVIFGRWLGSQSSPKPASVKVRMGDLRRHVQSRR